MNKANVFLLVIVSSLLTYISTATQPAATAGVAQEKWEYFRGRRDYYKSKDPSFDIVKSYEFSCPAGKISVSQERQESGEVSKPSYVVSFEEGFSLPFEDYEPSNDSYFESSKKCSRDFDLFKILGESVSGSAGWHLFQVDPISRSESESGISHTTFWHWRRRVQ